MLYGKNLRVWSMPLNSRVALLESTSRVILRNKRAIADTLISATQRKPMAASKWQSFAVLLRSV